MNTAAKPSRELTALLVALVDGHLLPDQEQRLIALMRTEAGAVDAYIDHLSMHAMLKWRHGVNAASPEKSRAGLEALAASRDNSNLRGQMIASGSADQTNKLRLHRVAYRHPTGKPSRWAFRVAQVALSYAAAIILPVLLGLYGFHVLPAYHLGLFAGKDPAAGTLQAAVDATWEAPHDGLNVGQELPADELYLRSGVAQFTLNNGVSIILEGPAKFHVDSATMAHLDLGKLTADVPHSAIGFTVRTPTADITDLGTTFGVTVAEDQSGEVQVIKGSVKTNLLAPAATPRQATVLTENHAVAFSPAETVLRSVPVVPHAYLTNLRNRVPLRLHNTGEGFISGADAHWQVVGNSDDPAWSARPAVVGSHIRSHYDIRPSSAASAVDKTAYIHYHLGDSAKSQWLTTSAAWPLFRNGNKLTFKTTVDLRGYDAGSARVHLRLMADDDLIEMRLNGRVTGVEFARSEVTVTAIHEFTLDRGFKDGVNTLEFVVLNRVGDATDSPAATRPTPMGLRVEMEGTAVRAAQMHP